MANLGPPGFFPFFVYLPAASQDLGATGICGQAQGRAGQGRAGQGSSALPKAHNVTFQQGFTFSSFEPSSKEAKAYKRLSGLVDFGW